MQPNHALNFKIALNNNSGGAPSMQPNHTINFKLALTNNSAGAVLGQHGRTIQNLSHSLGCIVKFTMKDVFFPGTVYRVGLFQTDIDNLFRCLEQTLYIVTNQGQGDGAGGGGGARRQQQHFYPGVEYLQQQPQRSDSLSPLSSSSSSSSSSSLAATSTSSSTADPRSIVNWALQGSSLDPLSSSSSSSSSSRYTGGGVVGMPGDQQQLLAQGPPSSSSLTSPLVPAETHISIGVIIPERACDVVLQALQHSTGVQTTDCTSSFSGGERLILVGGSVGSVLSVVRTVCDAFRRDVSSGAGLCSLDDNLFYGSGPSSPMMMLSPRSNNSRIRHQHFPSSSSQMSRLGHPYSPQGGDPYYMNQGGGGVGELDGASTDSGNFRHQVHFSQQHFNSNSPSGQHIDRSFMTRAMQYPQQAQRMPDERILPSSYYQPSPHVRYGVGGGGGAVDLQQQPLSTSRSASYPSLSYPRSSLPHSQSASTFHSGSSDESTLYNEYLLRSTATSGGEQPRSGNSSSSVGNSGIPNSTFRDPQSTFSQQAISPPPPPPPAANSFSSTIYSPRDQMNPYRHDEAVAGPGGRWIGSDGRSSAIMYSPQYQQQQQQQQQGGVLLHAMLTTDRNRIPSNSISAAVESTSGGGLRLATSKPPLGQEEHHHLQPSPYLQQDATTLNRTDFVTSGNASPRLASPPSHHPPPPTSSSSSSSSSNSNGKQQPISSTTTTSDTIWKPRDEASSSSSATTPTTTSTTTTTTTTTLTNTRGGGGGGGGVASENDNSDHQLSLTGLRIS